MKGKLLENNARYDEELADGLNDIVGIEKFFGKSILITGATGLVGSAIADLFLKLKEKNELRLFLGTRNVSKTQERFSGHKAEYEVVNFDLLDDTPLKGNYDYVFHCAGNANPVNNVKHPYETVLGNINGIKKILPLLELNDGKLIFISSSEVYGENAGKHLLRESDRFPIDFTNPRSCYPISKQCVETMLASYALEHGVNYVVCRPGHVYGPTMTNSDPRAASFFLRKAANGEDIIMKSTGMQLRSYIHVIDAATAIMSAGAVGKVGEAYNVSNSNSIVTIKEFAEECARLGQASIRFEQPSDLERRSYNMMSYSALDSLKIENLGWKGKYDLELGIKETISVLRSLK